ncbi:hypothetical protein [Hyphomonas pacifica]|uniref:hypothetical protein n=1 Tax=Hyphomonas pacifica TaxID=1280941 RepID=UPI000DBFD391|nr:hypothetical protein [Hyphomonas pacifica]RAN38232.1 hypothetical protein HY11_00030 [Hyphomonas pacifica]
MLEFITQGPGGFCSWLSGQGVQCSTPIFALNIWNLLSGFVLFLMGWMIAAFIIRYRSLHTFQITHGIILPHRSMDDVNIIKMHPYRMRDLLEEKRLAKLGPKELTAKLNEKYENRYFVVIFRENSKTVLKRELKILPVWVKTKENEVRADGETARLLKKGSASLRDDDTDAAHGVDGVFDLFVRPIRWWDVRHWLFHPNREVKVGVRVAFFITALEYSSDIWRVMRAVLTAPF